MVSGRQSTVPCYYLIKWLKGGCACLCGNDKRSPRERGWMCVPPLDICPTRYAEKISWLDDNISSHSRRVPVCWSPIMIVLLQLYWGSVTASPTSEPTTQLWIFSVTRVDICPNEIVVFYNWRRDKDGFFVLIFNIATITRTYFCDQTTDHQRYTEIQYCQQTFVIRALGVSCFFSNEVYFGNIYWTFKYRMRKWIRGLP